jgi:beta-galactosidase
MSIGHAEYPGNQCYVAGWKDSGRWGGTEPTVFDIFIATPSAGAREYDGPLPMIVSEHGHWEYINAGTGKTSDVRRGDGEMPMLNQALNHQQSHNLNRGLANMCGDGVFCGTDYLAYPSGTIDKFRLPKFSYYFWQSQRDPNLIIPGVNSGPTVYIANYWTAASPANVKVYSNCEQVKLYVNNVLQATHSPDTDSNSLNLLHPPFTFTGLTWQAGELKAEGYINGQSVATHIVKTPGIAASLNIRFDSSGLKTNGDIAFVYVSVLDANGTVVPNASNSISLNIISGPAVLVSPNQVQAEAGVATFLLRSTTEPGLITVQATASTLSTQTTGIVSQ